MTIFEDNLLTVRRRCQVVIDQIDDVLDGGHPSDWLVDYNLPDLKEAINMVLNEEE